MEFDPKDVTELTGPKIARDLFDSGNSTQEVVKELNSRGFYCYPSNNEHSVIVSQTPLQGEVHPRVIEVPDIVINRLKKVGFATEPE